MPSPAPSGPAAPSVSPSDLDDAMRRGQVVVIDVRKRDDHDAGHIPGAVHHDLYTAVDRGDLEAVDRLQTPPGTPVVTYCNRGRVAGIVAARLRARGVDAKSLAGGFEAWRAAHGPG